MSDEMTKITTLVESLPEGFLWPIAGKNYKKADLVEAVGAGQKDIIDAVASFDLPTQSLLGKRYVCLLCGTEILCVKAGEGALGCCGQPMLIKEPKPIPSSD